MTQAQCEQTARRLESQHDDLLRKIDELDRMVSDVLAEWTQIAEQDLQVGQSL